MGFNQRPPCQQAVHESFIKRTHGFNLEKSLVEGVEIPQWKGIPKFYPNRSESHGSRELVPSNTAWLTRYVLITRHGLFLFPLSWCHQHSHKNIREFTTTKLRSEKDYQVEQRDHVMLSGYVCSMTILLISYCWMNLE